MKRASLLLLLAMIAGILAACGGTPAADDPEPAPAEEAPAEEAPAEEEATEEEPMEEEAPAEEEATEEEPMEEEAPAEEGAEEEEPMEEEATEEEPMEEEAPEGGAGEFEGNIKIATQSPLSGPQAAIGVGIQQAADLGIEQLTAPLTELGFTVELAPFDDQAQPEVGTANANNIVSDPEILCVDGHLNSGVALAALPVYSGDDLVMVSPANTAPAVTEDFANAYRIVGRDDLQGPIGARFANDTLQASSVYIIHDTTDYGQGVAEFFQQEAETLGIQVVGFEGTAETSVFDSLITPITAANPDLIYFGGIYSQAGPFFRQARERGIESAFLGPDGMDNPELAELAGDAVGGMYYTSVAAPVSQFPDAAQFAQDYQDAYGEPAPPFSPQSYDAVGICTQAIAQAAEEAGGVPTRTQVLEAMQNLEPYDGITGTYTFDADGDPDPGTYYVLQVNEAGSPDEWDTNEAADIIESSPPAEE